MDAVKFVKEKRRMCISLRCDSCPVSRNKNPERCGCGDLLSNHTETYVALVEKWAEEHPLRTRQSEILKICPNAKLDSDGTIDICPKFIDDDFDDCGLYMSCAPCKENYWRKEIKADK